MIKEIPVGGATVHYLTANEFFDNMASSCVNILRNCTILKNRNIKKINCEERKGRKDLKDFPGVLRVLCGLKSLFISVYQGEKHPGGHTCPAPPKG
ncbi:MAG: hypothetical protein IPL71_01150 [Anaerolineales bacterium]|uniref:hypothetical protein n=1 Tax=Candidatus Villigracilis proximus TaxID=3140683 RepID=UPI003136A561|nr:hypothetical protein [Anaerolineales bacterium]